MMITRAEISNFKGISKCEVDDIKRVNLFIGKNDSGKSSIIEAIYHTCREFVEPNLRNIMGRRTDVFSGGREIWYRYDTKPEIMVSVGFKGIDIGLLAKMVGPQINTRLSISRMSSRKERMTNEITGATYMGKDFALTVGISAKRGVERLKPFAPYQYEELARYIEDAVFIDCRSKSHISDLESRLGQIKLAEGDVEFGNLLHGIYAKGKEWEFLPHPDSPDEKRLAIKENGKRIFLSDLGDGFRYGMSICATAMTVRNTGIFIEEIENHQHPGSLRELIPILVDFSRKNDLQFFITTHSYNVWNQFARGRAYNAKRIKEEFQCFIVERDVASGKVTAEPTNNVQRINEQLYLP